MNGWVVAAVAALWLIRVGVEARRWYWERRWHRAERAAEEAWETFGWPTDAVIRARVTAPRSHVSVRRPPFDQDG